MADGYYHYYFLIIINNVSAAAAAARFRNRTDCEIRYGARNNNLFRFPPATVPPVGGRTGHDESPRFVSSFSPSSVPFRSKVSRITLVIYTYIYI